MEEKFKAILVCGGILTWHAGDCTPYHVVSPFLMCFSFLCSSVACIGHVFLLQVAANLPAEECGRIIFFLVGSGCKVGSD